MDKRMMLAWLQGQAQKQELTTTKMQQKRLGIFEQTGVPDRNKMVNASLTEGTYEGKMIPDPSAFTGQTEVYRDTQQQRIANLLNTLATVDNNPDQVQLPFDPRLKQLGLDPNDPKFMSDIKTYRTRLAKMLGAKGVEVPDKITPDTQITGATVPLQSRSQANLEQQILSNQRREAIEKAKGEKLNRVRSSGAQQTAKASNTFTPRISLPGALGAAAIGAAMGAATEAGASVAGVYSTPDPKTRMQGEKTYNTDIGLAFDTDDQGELMADPAGMKAARERKARGQSFPTWYPEINENNMMLAWLQGQAQKQELTTTKMQQKRLGIK